MSTSLPAVSLAAVPKRRNKTLDLAREIEKILFQPDHAKRLVAQGRAELGQLCWRTAGERLGEIYFELTFEGALA